MKRLAKACCAGILVLGLASPLACRIDPGTPDYSGHVGLVDRTDAGPSNELMGPDPYMPGDDRLGVGVFYEGGRSEDIAVNGTTTNYFIFIIDGTMDLTYEQRTSEDRLEGMFSDEIRLKGTPFWGGGVIWNEPINLSGWTTLNVSFKSSDESFAAFNLTLQSGIGDAVTPFDLAVTDYGYTNDGEWHSLNIPLQDFIDDGFDISQVRAPFIVGAGGGMAGHTLLVDNLYFTKD